MEQDFDSVAWQAKCEKIVDGAHRGCGLVYEIFELRLCGSFEQALRALPEAHREEAIKLARTHGYVTAEEAAASSVGSSVDNGYCHHGFPPNCCPIGCDDVD